MHCCISLGTLDVTREGCGVGAKPEDNVWWIQPEDERILKFIHEVEIFCKTVQANLTDLSRIPGKPRSIIRLPTFQRKYYICVICIVALCIGVG
jgi:hypothetical protein